MMAGAYLSLIEKCEEALRAGRAQPVAHWLQGLNTARVPQAHRLSLANICRRANLFSLGLRILTSCVRDESATSAELAEYAVLLERCGAVDEALLFLRGVDTKEVPAAHLYRAFCYFKSWDYAAAIPELRAYAAGPLAVYPALIARVNLAAALVVTQDFGPALALLDENIRVARENQFSRLNANCLELGAQVHFHRGDFKAARANLNEAAKILGAEKTSDQLFVVKWQKILDAFESGNPAALTVLRREAAERDDGESAREADLFRMMIHRDERELARLFVGTPFAAYRERIRRELGGAEPAAEFRFGAMEGPLLQMQTGRIEGAALGMNPGKKIHQFLAAVTRDLYRPARIGSLFATLYPNEHFDIFTSPARVHQILFRTRHWLESNRIPVKIVEHNQAYALSVSGEFALGLTAAPHELNGYAAQFCRLTSAVGEKFTGREARAVLELSPATCKRILKWAVDAGKLERRGAVYSRAV